MTEHLKILLHDLGLLYITLNQLESKHQNNNRNSLEDYDKSLGELKPGEPAVVVRISKEGKSELIDLVQNSSGEPIENDYENIKILELPEDEFYFFEAFRLGIFNLEYEIPSYMHNMWIIYSFSLFENYLTKILKDRFLMRPQLLGKNKTLTLDDLLDSDSKDSLVEKFIDSEIRELLYLPINGLFDKMRTKFGFKKLDINYDLKIRRISLIRNCLVHNNGMVNDKLANEFSSEFNLNQKLELTSKAPFETINVIRKLAYEIDKTFENMKNTHPNKL